MIPYIVQGDMLVFTAVGTRWEQVTHTLCGRTGVEPAFSLRNGMERPNMEIKCGQINDDMRFHYLARAQLPKGFNVEIRC